MQNVIDSVFCQAHDHKLQSRRRPERKEPMVWQISCSVCGLWYDATEPKGNIVLMKEKNNVCSQRTDG